MVMSDNNESNTAYGFVNAHKDPDADVVDATELKQIHITLGLKPDQIPEPVHVIHQLDVGDKGDLTGLNFKALALPPITPEGKILIKVTKVPVAKKGPDKLDAGDIIVRVNGKSFKDKNEFIRFLKEHMDVTGKVKLTVYSKSVFTIPQKTPVATQPSGPSSRSRGPHGSTPIPETEDFHRLLLAQQEYTTIAEKQFEVLDTIGAEISKIRNEYIREDVFTHYYPLVTEITRLVDDAQKIVRDDQQDTQKKTRILQEITEQLIEISRRTSDLLIFVERRIAEESKERTQKPRRSIQGRRSPRKVHTTSLGHADNQSIIERQLLAKADDPDLLQKFVYLTTEYDHISDQCSVLIKETILMSTEILKSEVKAIEVEIEYRFEQTRGMYTSITKLYTDHYIKGYAHIRKNELSKLGEVNKHIARHIDELNIIYEQLKTIYAYVTRIYRSIAQSLRKAVRGTHPRKSRLSARQLSSTRPRRVVRFRENVPRKPHPQPTHLARRRSVQQSPFAPHTRQSDLGGGRKRTRTRFRTNKTKRTRLRRRNKPSQRKRRLPRPRRRRRRTRRRRL